MNGRIKNKILKKLDKSYNYFQLNYYHDGINMFNNALEVMKHYNNKLIIPINNGYTYLDGTPVFNVWFDNSKKKIVERVFEDCCEFEFDNEYEKYTKTDLYNMIELNK